MEKKHHLIGREIHGMKISADKMALLLMLDEKEASLALCEAECCSYTWIENIELPKNIFPTKVFSVEEIEMPDLGDMPGCDIVSYYGIKITTDKGHIIIDYRNDSNGYYGGGLVFEKENKYLCSRDYDQNILNQKWVDLKE